MSIKKNNDGLINSSDTIESELVRVSNHFARGQWGINGVMAPKIVMNVALQVKKKDTEFYDYQIPFKDISDSPRLGVKTRKELEEVAELLTGHKIRLEKEGGGYAFYRLFAKFSVDFDRQVVEVSFHPDLKIAFLALKGNFTLLSYINFHSLSTPYSQRLYRLLSSWKNSVTKIISLEDLHFTLETPPSVRSNFSDFNRRVLDVSLREINEKTELSVEANPQRRNGRKVIGIEFTFVRHHSDSEEKKRLIAVIVQEFGVSEREVKSRSADKSEETLESFIKYMRGVIKKGKIDNIASYAVTTLGNYVPLVNKEQETPKSFFESMSATDKRAWQDRYIANQNIPENLVDIVRQGLNESNKDFLEFIKEAQKEQDKVEQNSTEPEIRKTSDIWERAKEILKDTRPVEYESWIKPVQFWSEDEATFRLIFDDGDRYPTSYVRTHLLTYIEEALEEVGISKEVEFHIR